MAVCLLASAVILFFWIRSYSIGDSYRWFYRTPDGANSTYIDRRIGTGQGAIAVDFRAFGPASEPTASGLDQFLTANPRFLRIGYRAISLPGYPLASIRTESVAATFGFQFVYDDEADFRGIPGWRVGFGIPLWAILCLTAGYPIGRYVLLAIKAQRRERLALGLCPACGLAINEQTNRCPGCNRRIAAEVVSS